MPQVAIDIKNLSKQYHIAPVRSGEFRESLGRSISRFNPFQKIGQNNQLKSEKDHGMFWALKDISFQVNRGEAVGIIGRNGAGKSTLLKVLSKITFPDKGRIEINGRVSSLLEVGTGFHPELSGRENVFLNGTILGMRRKEVRNKFDQIVDFSGISRFIDTPVKHYSSGMKVRLAFSVAAFLEPEILIIDEVLAVGDYDFQKKCLGKMEDVTGQGRTVLFVSHNMGAVDRLCSRGILLEEGNLTFQGDQSSCIQQYLGLYDKESGSNLLERTDRRGTGQIIVKRIELSDKQGKGIDCVMVGRPFQLSLQFEIADPDFDAQNINVGIGAKNSNGSPVFLHHARLVDSAFNEIQIKGARSFVLNVHNLPLVPGQYDLHYSLMQGFDYIDHLEKAFTLRVIEGKYLNYKIFPKPVTGNTLIEADWRVI